MHIRITWGGLWKHTGNHPGQDEIPVSEGCSSENQYGGPVLWPVPLRTLLHVRFKRWKQQQANPLPHPFHFSSFGCSFLKLIRYHHMRGLSELCIFSTSIKCHCKMQQDTGSEIVFEDFKGDPFDLHSCYCNTQGEGHADSVSRDKGDFWKTMGHLGS